MPMILFVPSVPVAWAIALFSLAYFGQQSWSTLVMILPTDIFPKSTVGAVAGLVGFGGAMGGVVFGQLVGYLLDHGYGYGVVFALAGSLHVVAFATICLAIPRIRAPGRSKSMTAAHARVWMAVAATLAMPVDGRRYRSGRNTGGPRLPGQAGAVHRGALHRRLLAAAHRDQPRRSASPSPSRSARRPKRVYNFERAAGRAARRAAEGQDAARLSLRRHRPLQGHRGRGLHPQRAARPQARGLPRLASSPRSRPRRRRTATSTRRARSTPSTRTAGRARSAGSWRRWTATSCTTWATSTRRRSRTTRPPGKRTLLDVALRTADLLDRDVRAGQAVDLARARDHRDGAGQALPRHRRRALPQPRPLPARRSAGRTARRARAGSTTSRT